MSTVLWNCLGLGLVILGTPAIIVNTVLATDPPSGTASNKTVAARKVAGRGFFRHTSFVDQSTSLEQNLREGSALAQATSVSELSDVQSTDWTFQALQSLGERYGCTAGYVDSAYWGQRTLTRYEFAAGLNTCLDRVNKLIAGATAELVKQEDLVTLRRLQAEFAPELVTLEQRIDTLETRTTQLEVQQFSATTKLIGQVIFAISGANGGNNADEPDEQVGENLAFGSRARLTFDTSFTGEDRLRIRIQTTNAPEFDEAAGTDMARLSFQGDDNNQFELSRLEYRLPVSEQATVYFEVEGGSLDDFTDTLNPVSGSADGSISRFGQRNPIYRQSGGAGVGINYEFGEAASLSLGYLGFGSPTDTDEDLGSGEDNLELESRGGPYGVIAQLTLQPIEAIGLGLTYVRSFNDLDTGTGSELANDPFDEESDRLFANSYGVETTFEVNSAFTLGGWVGYTEATAADLSGNPEVSVFNYALTLAFPDLGKEDNLAGIVIGQPPKVTRSDLGKDSRDQDTSLHLEAFYRFQATDSIAVTPGVLIITNPEHNSDNDTVYIGTIRTTFSF